MPKQIQITRGQILETYNKSVNIYETAKLLNIDSRTLRKYIKLLQLDNVINITGRREYKLNENFFSEENEASFYVAGFIAADGCIKDKTKTKILEIRLGEKDTEHLAMVNILMGSNYPLHKWVSNKKDGTSSNGRVIKISSNKLCNDLQKFGIGPRKSLTYEFPLHLYNHPLIHHFIRGYIDGDGCFTKPGNSISLQVIGTLHFVKNLKNLFIEKCNIYTKSKHLYVKGKVHRIHFDGKKALPIINYLYKDVSIYLDRKYQIANNYRCKAQ